jgi:hypothetical protein
VIVSNSRVAARWARSALAAVVRTDYPRLGVRTPWIGSPAPRLGDNDERSLDPLADVVSVAESKLEEVLGDPCLVRSNRSAVTAVPLREPPALRAALSSRRASAAALPVVRSASASPDGHDDAPRGGG